MVKKTSSFVLARHCRLTFSAAFTNVTRFIQRVVNLRGSTYDTVRLAASFAAASLDGLFDHPLQPEGRGVSSWMGVQPRIHHYASQKKWLKTTNIAHAFSSIAETSSRRAPLGRRP